MVKQWLNSSQRLISRQHSSILSAAAIITASSLLSSLLGLLRNRLLVGEFFGSPLSRMQLDAYWVAFRLPELVFQILVIGSLSAAFIPVFAKHLKQNRTEAFAIASSVMNIVLLVFAAVAGVIFIWAVPFTRLFTSTNFAEWQILLAAQLTRIMLLAQFFFAISNFLTGAIQAEHRFLIPALSPSAYNLGIILGTVLLAPMIGIYGPTIGVVVGALLHLLMQIPLARTLGFVYRPKILLKQAGVVEMLRLMPPRIFAISVNQIELFATVFFATALPSGSLTIMNIATQLMSAPIRIFSVPMGQASLPFLSKTAADGEASQFKQTFLQSFHQVLFIALPAGMLLLILRIPLVRLAYGAAEFPWAATVLTGKVVAILALSVFASASIHVLTRVYYALHDTKIPLWIALISVLINISIAYLSVMVYHWGVIGLAFGVTVAALVQMSLLIIKLKPKISGMTMRELLSSPLKMGLATAAMGLALWIPLRLLDRYVFDTTRVLPLLLLTLIVSLIGAVVYLSLARMFRIPALEAYARILSKLGNWRSVLAQTEEVIEEPPTQNEQIKPW
ncbi:murein biosynthesis integral membrane protein MurJ [Microgenomates group bacterium RBG_16_45_19]|nr:MAG: murein biosynthesis integral membrane protein MurJ [Microgenomates group bacterium RBG_16_45_19]